MTALLDRDDRFAYLVLVTLRRYHMFVRGRAIADRRRASVQPVSEEDLSVRRVPPLFDLGWLAQRLFMRADLFLRDCRCGLAAMPLWMCSILVASSDIGVPTAAGVCAYGSFVSRSGSPCEPLRSARLVVSAYEVGGGRGAVSGWPEANCALLSCIKFGARILLR